MRKLLAIFLFAMALAVPAFAQESSVSCDVQHIGGVDFRVCKFDGKVAVDMVDGSRYWSAVFSNRAQFRAWERKQEAAGNNKHTNRKSEVQAQSWHTENGCASDGFKWHDDGCHAK